MQMLVKAIILIVSVLILGVGVYLLDGINQKYVPKHNQIHQEKQDENPVVGFLICGTDEAGLLTDVIFYVMMDTKTQSINILQIPRDSYIGEEYKSGKINAVYGAYKNHKEGISALKDVIEEQFILPIDYTAVVSLSAFREAIDDLGGVEMEIEQQIDFMENKVLYQGVQTLTGEQCEWLVRYRKGYATGDIGRMDVQKDFLTALFHTIKSKGKLDILSVIKNNFSKVITDISVSELMKYAKDVFSNITEEDIALYTLKGEGVLNNGHWVYNLDKENVSQILNDNFRPYTDKKTAIDLPLAEVQNPNM